MSTIIYQLNFVIWYVDYYHFVKTITIKYSSKISIIHTQKYRIYGFPLNSQWFHKISLASFINKGNEYVINDPFLKSNGSFIHT